MENQSRKIEAIQTASQKVMCLVESLVQATKTEKDLESLLTECKINRESMPFGASVVVAKYRCNNLENRKQELLTLAQNLVKAIEGETK